jgi:uncharacterized protein YbjT (DUF2867 family)
VRITVLGGTGKIGRLVVGQLLAAGHQVTALVRTPQKMAVTHRSLAVRVGQLSDADAVRAALAGSDAVISALGPSLKPGARGAPLTGGMRTVVAIMQDEGVRRFVGLATPSIPDPRDRPTARARILPLLARLMFPRALADLVGMTAAVTESELDWTIARITRPTGKSAAGTVRAGFLGVDDVGSAMSRVDIAAFLVGQLTDRTYSRAAPAISN